MPSASSTPHLPAARPLKSQGKAVVATLTVRSGPTSSAARFTASSMLTKMKARQLSSTASASGWVRG